jgi:hypothetical protein
MDNTLKMKSFENVKEVKEVKEKMVQNVEEKTKEEEEEEEDMLPPPEPRRMVRQPSVSFVPPLTTPAPIIRQLGIPFMPDTPEFKEYNDQLEDIVKNQKY